MSDWLTVNEAAQLVYRSPDAVYRWIRTGQLKANRDITGRQIVKSGDVLKVESNQRHGRPQRLPSLKRWSQR